MQTAKCSLDVILTIALLGNLCSYHPHIEVEAEKVCLRPFLEIIVEVRVKSEQFSTQWFSPPPIFFAYNMYMVCLRLFLEFIVEVRMKYQSKNKSNHHLVWHCLQESQQL